MQLVLSTFTGAGLLDMAFEAEGFCVVSLGDIIFGRDIRKQHVPSGKFDGVIGGPPCQSHCTYAALNKAQGKKVREDLVHEYARIVEEAQPEWWLMENAPNVPDIHVPGYQTHPFMFNPRWLGYEQDRQRKFQFGTRDGRKIWPETEVFENPQREPVCMASEGRSGMLKTVRVNGKPRTRHSPRRSPSKFCQLQGLPPDFMDHLPFTNEWKYRVVGNGVHVEAGRAIARAVSEATRNATAMTQQ